MNPEHALIIARTLSHAALILGAFALCGLALLIAEFLREGNEIGRDIDEAGGGK